MRIGVGAGVLVGLLLLFIVISIIDWAFDIRDGGTLFILGVPLLIAIMALLTKLLPRTFSPDAFDRGPRMTAGRVGLSVLFISLWVLLYAWLFTSSTLARWQEATIALIVFGFLVYLVNALEIRWSRIDEYRKH